MSPVGSGFVVNVVVPLCAPELQLIPTEMLVPAGRTASADPVPKCTNEVVPTGIVVRALVSKRRVAPNRSADAEYEHPERPVFVNETTPCVGLVSTTVNGISAAWREIQERRPGVFSIPWIDLQAFQKVAAGVSAAARNPEIQTVAGASCDRNIGDVHELHGTGFGTDGYRGAGVISTRV